MRVLMLGWEFPPFISGGLGAACYGLTKAMTNAGAQVLFVLPRSVPTSHTSHVRLLTPDSPEQVDEPTGADEEVVEAPQEELQAGNQPTTQDTRFFRVEADLRPYARPGPPPPRRRVLRRRRKRHLEPEPAQNTPGLDAYGGDLFAEVQRYARTAARLALAQRFDVIHAHDWMTYAAGLRIAELTGKPLVVHVHSTEFDRSGETVDPRIFRIEQAGVTRANAVLAVSNLTRIRLETQYGVPPGKTSVVYNGLERNGAHAEPLPVTQKSVRTVLFLGRLTRQKGPGFFLAAARLVRAARADVRFVMAGSGDLLASAVRLTQEMDLEDAVVFPGFLRGAEVDRVYRMADVYVMPSVSEPFGLVALEAISHGVPTIVSRQSGVAEVLDGVIKVDYWDVEDLARQILRVLDEPGLQADLRARSQQELRELTWAPVARRCLDAYHSVVRC